MILSKQGALIYLNDETRLLFVPPIKISGYAPACIGHILQILASPYLVVQLGI